MPWRWNRCTEWAISILVQSFGPIFQEMFARSLVAAIFYVATSSSCMQNFAVYRDDEWCGVWLTTQRSSELIIQWTMEEMMILFLGKQLEYGFNKEEYCGVNGIKCINHTYSDGAFLSCIMLSGSCRVWVAKKKCFKFYVFEYVRLFFVFIKIQIFIL